MFILSHDINSFESVIGHFRDNISLCIPSSTVYHHRQLSIFERIPNFRDILMTADVMLGKCERLVKIESRIGLWGVSALILMLCSGWRQVTERSIEYQLFSHNFTTTGGTRCTGSYFSYNSSKVLPSLNMWL